MSHRPKSSPIGNNRHGHFERAYPSGGQIVDCDAQRCLIIGEFKGQANGNSLCHDPRIEFSLEVQLDSFRCAELEPSYSFRRVATFNFNPENRSKPAVDESYQRGCQEKSLPLSLREEAYMWPCSQLNLSCGETVELAAYSGYTRQLAVCVRRLHDLGRSTPSVLEATQANGLAPWGQPRSYLRLEAYSFFW